MKTLTQKEILELVRTKKLSPDVLKSYKEAEDEEDEKPKEALHEEKLIEAIYTLVAAIAKNDNSKTIIEAIQNQPRPEIKVENIIEKEDDKPERWEFEILRDGNNMLRKIIAEAK